MELNQLQLNAMMKASTEAMEREHHETRELLRKYFKKSKETEALYYYVDKGKKIYYNIIKEKGNLFERDVQELGKEHIRMHIKMIDKRTDDYKMLLGMVSGYYMQDLNFTVFDWADNVSLSKYSESNEELEFQHRHNCLQCRAINPHEKVKEKKKLTEEEEKKELELAHRLMDMAKHINSEVNDKGKEDVKKMRYGPDTGIGADWKRKYRLYLGCEVSLETDPEWMNFYLEKE